MTSFAYAVLLIGALVQFANWVAPYENLTEDGCRIDYVYDGDTVALDCGGEMTTARLTGFDTPEVRDPGCAAEAQHGAAATNRLRALIASGAVTLSGRARDKYDRLLVSLRVDGVDVGDTLIAEGLAVGYDGGTRTNWCERLAA